jgi:hypothetical protein
LSEITYTQSFPINGNSDFMLVTWNGLALNDTGLPFVLSQYADRSVQVGGTFGAGGLVVVEGSNDSTAYATLNDPQGNPISISTPKIETISEIVVAIRPKVTAGDVTTSVNISMLVRKN